MPTIGEALCLAANTVPEGLWDMCPCHGFRFQLGVLAALYKCEIDHKGQKFVCTYVFWVVILNHFSSFRYLKKQTRLEGFAIHI